MTISKYFKSLNSPLEQKLLRGLVKEAIRHKGLDIKYLPRTLVKEDPIYGEDVLSRFTTSYKIEAYIKSFENFGGKGDFLGNLGLEVRDELTLTVAVEVFQEVVGVPAGIPRPMEGDLIYFPMGNNNLWEVKFVEDKSVFFNLGSLYVYDLICTMYEYSNEQVDTTDTDISDIINKIAYTIELVLGAGSGDYELGEQLYQGADLSSATFKGVVVGWNGTTKKVLVNNIVGEPIANTNVIGNTSTADYILTSADTMQNVNDTENNTVIETGSDDIVDRTEKSPFGDV